MTDNPVTSFLTWLSGLLPVSRNQHYQLQEDIMNVDRVLHAVADKIDASVDRILAEFDRLAEQAARGRPSPEALARFRGSIERLHNVVPEAEAEAEGGGDDGEDEQYGEEELVVGGSEEEADDEVADGVADDNGMAPVTDDDQPETEPEADPYPETP